VNTVTPASAAAVCRASTAVSATAVRSTRSRRIVSPPLIARDVQNNALPLYLARPLSRRRYVAGKLAVLIGPLSLITWVFGLVVIAAQVAYESGWLRENYREAVALVVGGGVLVLVLSLVALAVSALVQRQWVARGVMLGGLLVLRGLGGVINELFETGWGDLFAPTRVVSVRNLIRNDSLPGARISYSV